MAIDSYGNQLFAISLGVIIAIGPVTVAGYNVDSNHPIIQETRKTAVDSYFGYTVILYRDAGRNASWLIVGAPLGDYAYAANRGNKSQSQSESESESESGYPYQPGVVYLCDLSGPRKYAMPGVLIDERGFLTEFRMEILVKKTKGWFGSSMAVQRDTGRLTVCAPRTIVALINPYKATHLDTMHGMCYTGVPFYDDHLYIEDKYLSNYDFRADFWYNPLRGFSVHYPSIKGHGEASRAARIVGKPNHEIYGSVDVTYGHQQKSIDPPINDEMSHFGYSVTSGCFFESSRLLYAVAAPGWRYTGMVGIIDPWINSSVVAKLQGSEVGEYFGASLAVGDLNGDGLDDLLVGAPHWASDNGRVYVYLGNAKETFDLATTLEGIVDGAQFGYAIACGDLDKDGFADIILGAPWEDSGVVYIYNGQSDLKNNKKLLPSQRIAAADLQKLQRKLQRDIIRFGFSISEPVDIDANGYLDIAVGAYKSGHAVILRGKPVVKANLSLAIHPTTLQRNTTNFTIVVCVQHRGNTVGYAQNSEITVTIDERYKRAKETFLQLIHASSSVQYCVKNVVEILGAVQNFIEPIVIIAKHRFLYDNSETFCASCPIESKANKLNAAYATLPFDIQCGEDKICNSNISASAKFYGVRNETTWLVGSNDIILEASLRNEGEPAYYSLVSFVLPDGVSLRSILPFCQDTSDGRPTITCDLGNPLERGKSKIVRLDLDMQRFAKSSLDNDTLEFQINIKTHSTNVGVNSLSLNLSLASEAAVSLNGKANDESYYLPELHGQKLRVTFQHTYQTIKLGSTPIFDARLTVRIPTAVDNLDIAVYAYKPQIYISGKPYECFTENITLLEARTVDAPTETPLERSNETFAWNATRRVLFGGARTKRTADSSVDETRAAKALLALHAEQAWRERFDALRNGIETRLTYVNCSTRGVECATVTCDLSTLKTPQDVGKLIVKLVIDASNLTSAASKTERIIKYSTQARAEIVQPKSSIPVPGARPNLQLTTAFYGTAKAQRLQPWIVIVSVLLGLALLCLFIVVLRTLGFFKRNKEAAKLERRDQQPTDERGKTRVSTASPARDT